MKKIVLALAFLSIIWAEPRKDKLKDAFVEMIANREDKTVAEFCEAWLEDGGRPVLIGDRLFNIEGFGHRLCLKDKK